MLAHLVERGRRAVEVRRGDRLVRGRDALEVRAALVGVERSLRSALRELLREADDGDVEPRACLDEDRAEGALEERPREG